MFLIRSWPAIEIGPVESENWYFYFALHCIFMFQTIFLQRRDFSITINLAKYSIYCPIETKRLIVVLLVVFF